MKTTVPATGSPSVPPNLRETRWGRCLTGLYECERKSVGMDEFNTQVDARESGFKMVDVRVHLKQPDRVNRGSLIPCRLQLRRFRPCGPTPRNQMMLHRSMELDLLIDRPRRQILALTRRLHQKIQT